MLMAVACLMAGCAQSGDIFPPIGTNVATPSAMAVDVAANRLYMVNSNSEVLYDWTQGTLQVLDITDPLVPVLLQTTPTLSYSGEIYYDVANTTAYIPNRYSVNSQATNDRLYTFDLDETSAAFATYTESTLGRDAYAISCCYPARRVWITTSLDAVQYVDLDTALTPTNVSLLTDLDTGGRVSNAYANHIVVRDNQAFLSREFGGVMVLNLDKAGAGDAVPVDYYISDIGSPRGIAIDGNTLYVVGEGSEGGSYKRFLMVLDVSTLTPIAGNTTTVHVDKDDAGILTQIVEIGLQPQEVLLTTDYAMVTNMQDDTVSVVNRTSLIVDATITVGRQPFSLALYQDGAGVDRYVYIGNVESNTLSIIDLSTLTVVATYP